MNEFFSYIGSAWANINAFLNDIASSVSTILYSAVLIILLVVGGIYFTVRIKASQITMLPAQIKCVAEKPDKAGGVSSLGALLVSTSSRVGTGNIVGVSTAICLGGFGSVFWMWVITVIGAASAFVESTLAQIFKKRGKDGSYGGPAYYIESALKLRPLAIIFSVILIFTYGCGFNMLASYNLQSSFAVYSFYNESVTPWIIGGAVALLTALCLFGGGRRIVKTTSLILPVIGIAYILVAIVVVIMNGGAIGGVFAKIFSEAFDFSAIFGGFGGSCIMYGIKRGLFSNEAGVGSAPNASAAAEVSHPAKQGLVQMLSVFIDTIVICTATALMCLCSGVEPTEELAGMPYVQAAVSTSLGNFGITFITISLVLFAFTTILGNLFYVDKAFNHILKKAPSRTFRYVYYAIASALVLFGAVLNSDLLWNVSDIFMGLMALINVPVIIILGKYAFRALEDYKAKKKSGASITFRASDIGLKAPLDYWQGDEE